MSVESSNFLSLALPSAALRSIWSEAGAKVRQGLDARSCEQGSGSGHTKEQYRCVSLSCRGCPCSCFWWSRAATFKCQEGLH